ncbi:TRCF domain-containing protein [Nakamurella sp. GG22]
MPTPNSWVSAGRLMVKALPRRPADVDAGRDELVDRYGPLEEQLKNLLAVAPFRQLCRSLRVT